MLTSAHSDCFVPMYRKIITHVNKCEYYCDSGSWCVGQGFEMLWPPLHSPPSGWLTNNQIPHQEKEKPRKEKRIFQHFLNQLEFSLLDALPCWAQSVFWDMLAPNSFFPPKRIKCPVLWRNDRRLFEEIVRNLWSFAKRQEQPRWMGAIPYWWLTTQTSQKAGSRFDFHTKSWFRVSSEPLPPTWPTPANDVWSHTNP